ncbi:MAG: hypothetical protein V3T60_02705 [Candidatus Binatia bacterium]
MNTSRRRYNAGVQRGKGLLDLAAAPYDGSLSFESTRGAQGTVQTDSRVGSRIKLFLTGAHLCLGSG